MNRVVGISGWYGRHEGNTRSHRQELPAACRRYPVCLVSLYRRTADSRFLKNAQTCQRAFSRPRSRDVRHFLAVGNTNNSTTPCICLDLFIFSAYCNSHHWFSNCGYVRKFRSRGTARNVEKERKLLSTKYLKINPNVVDSRCKFGTVFYYYVIIISYFNYCYYYYESHKNYIRIQSQT